MFSKPLSVALQHAWLLQLARARNLTDFPKDTYLHKRMFNKGLKPPLA